MRIAHVTFSYQPIRGGADTYLWELYRALDAAGHHQVVLQRASGWHGHGIVEIPTRPGWSPGRQFWLQALYLRSYRSMLRTYDRVIAHYPIYALALQDNPGLIGVSHGVTWDCGGATAANRTKRILARLAFNLCRSFVSNDTLFLREMKLPIPPGAGAFTPVRPRRWFVPNCVDAERFCPDGPRAPLPERTILVPRNLYRNRGVHLAIAAFLMRGITERHRLVILGGDGDAGYRQELLAQVAKDGLSDRVIFQGSVPWERMADYYRSAALTVIPSLCGEGTSLAALESMSCGTPVVATAVGGLPDLPCLLAEPEPAPLAERVAEALDRREELALEQRSIVAEQFGLPRWAAAWCRIVEER